MQDDTVKDYATLYGVAEDVARDRLLERLGSTSEDMILPAALRPAVELAIHSHDQLRSVAGLGGVGHLAFDQTAVEAVSRMHGIALTPQNARDLHILQAEALRILASSK